MGIVQGIKNLFSKHWLNNGRTGEYCDQHGIDKPRLESQIKDFLQSDVGKITLLALEDFKDHWTGEMRNLDLNAPGHTKQLLMISYYLGLPAWFKAFFVELKGFEESEREDGPDLQQYT